MNIEPLEPRSGYTAVAAVAALNARLNDLQDGGVALRNQHRELVEARYSPTTRDSPTDLVEYMREYDDGEVSTGPPTRSPSQLGERYDRAVHRYGSRLQRVRAELCRLETEGLSLSDQRRRLSRFQSDFDNRNYRHNETWYLDFAARSREIEQHSQDMILPVPDRFTASPQPLQEHMSSGAVRALSASTAGPEMELPREMELPPLRRMGNRTINLTTAEMIDGLDDHARDMEAEEENWNAMLSTIAPDTRLPSASSSFASTAASLSFGGSNDSSRATSAFSYGTSITVPDDGHCDPADVWRNISDRFHRGEDVPDEMWMSVGAPLPVASTMARTTRRERL